MVISYQYLYWWHYIHGYLEFRSDNRCHLLHAWTAEKFLPLVSRLKIDNLFEELLLKNGSLMLLPLLFRLKESNSKLVV